MEKISLLCIFYSYMVAMILELSQFVRRYNATRVLAILFSIAGFVAHTAYILARSRHHDLPPLLSSTHEWILVCAWLVMALYLGIQLWNPKLSLGIFVLPLSLLLVCIAPLTNQTPLPQMPHMRWWAMFHATSWSLGLVGVALACLTSMMYLIQHNRLKQKRMNSPSLKLLSLERLGRLNWWLVIVSVPLQTVGMATGFWLIHLSKKFNHPVEMWSTTVAINVAMWIAMALLFGWMLGAKNPTGRIVAVRTFLACIFMIMTFIALKIGNADKIHNLGGTTVTGGSP